MGLVFPARAGMSPPVMFTVRDPRVFPARAGMSRVSRASVSVAICFPRPRGDEPGQERFARELLAFSPPARG